VLPTRLPLHKFYEQLVSTQAVLNRKHLGLSALRSTAVLAARLAMRGQTNFVRSLWKFSRVYSADRQAGDHERPVKYAMRAQAAPVAKPKASDLFVHIPLRKDVAVNGTAAGVADPLSAPRPGR